MPKPLTKEERELARKAKKVLREGEVALIHFKESDRLLNELLTEADVSKPIPLNRQRKRIARFVDNFAKGNTCFRPKAVKRFELEIVELP